MARKKRVRKFLVLTQNSRTLAEYVAQFHHLERYYPHMFATELERADKFVWGLSEGLRSKVISKRPHTLLEVIEMATRLDDDYASSLEPFKRHKGLAVPHLNLKEP